MTGRNIPRTSAGRSIRQIQPRHHLALHIAEIPERYTVDLLPLAVLEQVRLGKNHVGVLGRAPVAVSVPDVDGEVSLAAQLVDMRLLAVSAHVAEFGKVPREFDPGDTVPVGDQVIGFEVDESVSVSHEDRVYIIIEPVAEDHQLELAPVAEIDKVLEERIKAFIFYELVKIARARLHP